jgi:clan AA aspartic protease
MPKIPQEFMGRIITTLAITNRLDEEIAERGLMAHDEVRSITLDDVFVDTGATTLCLPSDIIEQLGLKLLRTVEMETATGISQARIFQDAKILLLGREGRFECLELPDGRSPLLGVIPLEALGIELDLQNQILKTLPINPTQTYLTII